MSCHPILALTTKEKEAIALIRQGLSNRQIAEAMNVKTRTIDTHIYNAMRKLNAKNRIQIVLILDGRMHPSTEIVPTLKNSTKMRRTEVKKLKEEGLNGMEISKVLGISDSTVYKIFGKLGYQTAKK